jgi:AMP phosphorylase
MAGKLLEISGMVAVGEGRGMAESILRTGKAYEKMKEIIKAQGGNPDVGPGDIALGKHKGTVYSKQSGKIFEINNIFTSRIARIAGAPRDKGAGIFMRVEKGQYIKEGDPLFDIYSVGPRKLETAMELAETINPIEMSQIVLGEYH